MANDKAKYEKKKYVSAAKGYNQNEGYFQSMLKAVKENPEPKSYTKKDMAKHQKELNQSARQKQIIDFRKKSLTLKKLKHGGKTKHFRGNRQFD